MSLTERIKEKAYELGFDLIGVAPAARAPHADAYASWVDAGYAAGMGYLARDVQRRQDPRHVLPGACSVVVVGLSYFVADPPADLWNDPSRGRIARYAWGPDYQEVMTPRLRQLADLVSRQVRGEATYRVYVDTGPVLEQDFAAQAGLGFIGKNTCLIHPGIGSYLFLGEILVGLELDYDEPAVEGGARIQARPDPGPGGPARPRVGTCSACTATRAGWRARLGPTDGATSAPHQWRRAWTSISSRARPITRPARHCRVPLFRSPGASSSGAPAC